MSNDQQQIREVIQKWMTATKEGDIETVLGLMTDDVVFLVAGQKPFGKEAFRKAAKEIKSGEPGGIRYEGKSDIEEIKVVGDFAYVRNRLEVTTRSSDESTPIYRSGYTLSIFHKESDGRWRLARDANLLTVKK